jgi:NAD(P)-dependent dehydrogenase (short-subunit alcohol dehydrogenase family)
MTFDLNDRTALITGSTSGIGAAVAGVLAAAGAHVIVTGRDAGRGEKVVAGIVERGGRAAFVRADLGAGIGEIRALAANATAAADGRIDILVNNAGSLLYPAPTAEVDADTVERVLAVHVKAAFFLTGLIAPGMAGRGRGAIVNMGSLAGSRGMAGFALYNLAKAAVHSMTMSWADEYGPSGVRVNTVAPGSTLTEQVAASAELIAPMLARFPSRRASYPEEVGNAVAFLVSDEAANIHGALLPVDGGASVV